jgi:hypothetical protein
MKVYISVDIEGAAGIAHWDEAAKRHGDYPEFRERMTAEAVAACEGLGGRRNGDLGQGRPWLRAKHLRRTSAKGSPVDQRLVWTPL